MKKLTLIFTIFFIISCGNNVNTSNSNKSDNALKFINAYVEFSNKTGKKMDIIEWVNSIDMTTKGFKSDLKKIVDQAYEQNPEFGLEADPIFDAQDYPSKGFEIESFEQNSNYLTIKGIDWTEFKLNIKIIEENGNWLVDGCGIVNIPTDKRAKR